MGGGSYTYRSSGVGHQEQERLNRAALAAAGDALGGGEERLGYVRVLEARGLRLSLHTDGVGTKTLVLEETGELWVAGWDCVAMNANDLAVAGHRAIAYTDYIALPRPDAGVVEEVVRGAARAAKTHGAVLLGGETAVLPGVATGLDVVCTALGVEEARPAPVGPGYVLVGVESSGLHSNGYSLARRIVEERLGGYDTRIGGATLGELLSRPTLIYHDLVLEAYRRGLAAAAAHLTGGGWAKLRRILLPGTLASLQAPEPPRLFRVLQEAGNVATGEMYRVFNMGTGLVMAAAPGAAEELIELAGRHGLRASVLGETVPGERGQRAVQITTARGETVLIE